MEENCSSNVRNREEEGSTDGKRQKVEHNHNPAAASAVASVVAVSDQKEIVCGICFEGSTAENSVQGHQCSTCKADAWHVCGVCNSSLLSRACPFCKSDYAPMILHEVPGRHLSDVRSASIDGREKMILMIKIKFLESLIPAGNTLLWYPVGKDGKSVESNDKDEEGVALFCLPKEFFAREKDASGLGQQPAAAANDTSSEAHGEGEGAGDCEVILVSLSMSKSELRLRAVDGSFPDGEEPCCFHFLNETWNHLLCAAEGGADGANRVTPATAEGIANADSIAPQPAAVEAEVSNATRAKSAATILRQAITNPRSRLFLPMAADQWEELEESWRENVIVGRNR